MKVANIKSGSLVQTKVKQVFNSIYMHPCFYAAIEKSDKRKNWLWKIGCKKENEKSEELMFKMYKFGDVNDEKVWQKVTNIDFAIMLIGVYRESGEAGIKQLIKDNSPQGI